MIITIVTATYNAESVLENLINSIISQKTDEIEFIIIDGGSTDGTIDIIKKYENYINYWISEPDKGIYDAWNKGVKAANGEWIMFLGADDELLSNALKQYLNLLNKDNFSSYDYISAQNEYVNHDNQIIKLLGNGANWDIMKKGMSAAHVASLHHKENLFGNVGFYNLDFKICADYEILLRKKQNLKSYFLPVRIAKMKVGGMSFTSKAIKETYKIRQLHKTVSPFFNKILFYRDLLAYNLFKLRKSV